MICAIAMTAINTPTRRIALCLRLNISYNLIMIADELFVFISFKIFEILNNRYKRGSLASLNIAFDYPVFVEPFPYSGIIKLKGSHAARSRKNQPCKYLQNISRRSVTIFPSLSIYALNQFTIKSMKNRTSMTISV